MTANPDGTFTLDQSVEPVRKQVSGHWTDLDPTLVRNADGSVSPTVTTSQLTLSGGGSGPFAVMRDGSRSMRLTLSPTLPSPQLSGNTATYAEVLPGVDLKVIADDQGGFSDVLVVKNASAAANPELKNLTKFTTQATGVKLTADTAGNITADDASGKSYFSAPAPLMWDSATPPTAPSVTSAKSLADSSAEPTDSGDSGQPVESSPAGPGVAAHTAAVDSDYSNGTITLTPDASLLTGSSTVFPLYIDPPYAAGGGTLQAWTYVDSYRSDYSFWKTTDSAGLRVGRQGWDSPFYTGRTFAQLSVDSRIYGSIVDDSHFYATETYAPSCTAEPVDLWTTDGISQSTTWENQPRWITKVASQTVAHGWDGCDAASVGFDTKSAMADIAAHPKSSITLGLRAADESDRLGWKKFDHATMRMSTTFDRRPAVPSKPHTSPATNCTGTVTVVGNGDVTLYATVSDPDGGTLPSVKFQAWKTGTSTTIASGTPSAPSGTIPSLRISRATLDNAAGSALMSVSWNVTANDGYASATSASTTCRFTFDPTIPGAPDISDPTGASCGDSQSTAQYTVGTSATFTIHPAAGSAPSSYLYQLNGAAPLPTTKTSFPITPTRGADILTVTALSAGGNVGDTASCTITAAAPATAPDGDLNGDGIADLVTVGNQNTLPPGLWLAPGQVGTGHTSGDGQVVNTATNIGVEGTGVDANGTASDWNGTQAITGHFATGAGFNDVLDYDPATGVGHILYGSGDGSPLAPISGDEVNVVSDFFTDTATGAHASQIANGGGLWNSVNDPDNWNSGPIFPDLIFTLEGTLYLEASDPTPGAFVGIDNAWPLADVNPTGSGDWTGWTITTSLINGLPSMFAASADGESSYYYSPEDLQNLVSGNPVQPVLTNIGWGDNPVLQAADINTDGTPDLWLIDSDEGSAWPSYFDGHEFHSGPSGQSIVTDTHNWSLSDSPNGNATKSADNANTPLTLTGAGAGARWDDDDLFNPHLNLDGTSSAVMNGNAALTSSASFSVSVWVKAQATGGVVVSQDGAHTSSFLIYPDTATKTWDFCMAQADTTTTARDCARGGAVHLGAWSHITATYNATSHRMALYTDGIETGEFNHTPVVSTGHFTVGRQLYQGINQSNFTGAVANVEVWAGTTLTPDQAAILSGTPGYVLFPSDNTNYASGTTWTTAGAKMTFNAGQLTITKTGTCTAACTWNMGTTGHSGSVLTFQNDGNLVAYTGASHTLGTSLWATNTYAPSGGSVLFLQPDGNLVIYDYDGTWLWASNTAN